MTPLPPVRKRTSYADIKADDLVMALFTDRVLGTDAMSPLGELAATLDSTKGVPMPEADAHPGAMVCLIVPDDVQVMLAEEYGGDEPDHVTVCYIARDASAIEGRKNALIRALAQLAESGPPVQAELGGLARFNATPSSDGMDVIVALIDGADLPMLHAAVCEALDEAEIEPVANHGFIPHITLEYIDPARRTPNVQFPREPVVFPALSLVWAGERIDFPFAGAEGNEYEAEAEGEDSDEEQPMAMPVAAKHLPPAEVDEDEDDLVLAPFGAIKSFDMDAGRLLVKGVKYGGLDMVGDEFEPATDLGFSRSPVGMPVYYDHAQRGLKSQIGTVTGWKADEDGIDFEIELDRHHKYVETVKRLYRERALGGSTGAASHLVIRQGGKLKRWIVAELSLTPTPAEPRTTAAFKSDQQSGDTPEARTEVAPATVAGGAVTALVGIYGDMTARRIARRYGGKKNDGA